MRRTGRRGPTTAIAFILFAGSTACGADVPRSATPEESKPFVGKLPTVDSMDYRIVAFSPDGKLLATSGLAGGASTVQLWSATTGKQIGKDFAAQPDLIGDVQFSPDSSLLATTTTDGKIKFYDSSTRKSLGEVTAATDRKLVTLAFGPDGKTMAVTSAEDGMIRIREVPGGRVVGRPMAGSGAPIGAVVFSPDGRSLVTTDSGLEVRRWSVDNAQLLGTVKLKGDAYDPRLSRDGTLVAGTSYETVRLYDTSTGKLAAEFGPGAGHWNETKVKVAFSAAGDRLVTFGTEDPEAGAAVKSPTEKDRITIRIWDRTTGKQIGAPTVLPGGTNVSVAFSPTGDRIVIAAGTSVQIVSVA